ncbi:MAG: adenosylcobalamin-dependent ribonucleoside-diphosphate reductase [bacterium]
MEELTSNARRVLQARYLRRDGEGEADERPEDMFRRVARGVAHAETLLHGPEEAAVWEERFFDLLAGLEFLPNSPTLMNAGTHLGQLSGCFVLAVPDSMEGIFDALKQMALIQQSGGGTGFAFSRLRPRGALISSTGGESSGPVSFMEIFNCATEHIKQGGRRRGANMGVLRVDHPDIEDFVSAKEDPSRLRNFNLSVAATDAFMEAAAAGASYALVDPRTGEQVGERDAAEIMGRIAAAAWSSGDPGMFFLDRANRSHPLEHLGEIEATNPCGEIPLLPYESCNLGSINLSRMTVREGERTVIDRRRLEEVTRDAVRFLDDVIEVNRYPLEPTGEITRANRKIGLGVMGFADLLVGLEVPYASQKAVKVAEEVMERIAAVSREASVELAERRGVFPNWKGSEFERRDIRVRNATRNAVAPTGTISIIAGTSPSIEPFYSLAYRRQNVLSGQTLRTVNPLLQQWVEEHGLDLERVMRQVKAEGSLEGMEDLPGEMKELFRTAAEIDPDRHLAIQAAFQRHTDNAVSKTINLPADFEAEGIARLYGKAWELGLKGVTVFRTCSKGGQVMEAGMEEQGR